jgi:glycosyltransferase involved in cell wall biosynthesis
MPFYHETHFSFLSNAPLVLGPLSLPWMLEDNEIESPHFNNNPAKKLAKGVLEKISQRRYYRTLNRAQSILVAVGAMHNSLPLQLQEKSKLVPFGVNTDQFEPSDNQGPKPTILFLANLLKRKGLRFLLEAMPSVIQNIPDVKLNVVGGGPSEVYFRNLVKDWGISSHVEFVGPVSHNKTIKWFQQCDLYCLPSLGEPFGISLLEAMSCGKPVVTTRAGGVPDFVEDGKCGYLVPPRDRQALATAIIKILTDRSLAKKMGDYNRELCINNYDWEIIVDKIENAYEEVLSV